MTPLHAATRSDILKTLVKHGAATNAKDSLHRTPLWYLAHSAGTEGVAEMVDFLLRSGADETIVDEDGRAPVDVLGGWFEGDEHLMLENVEPVRRLLANAPSDRAWRRRGYLVLCRAFPEKVQQREESSRGGAAGAAVARRNRQGTKLARAEAGGGGGAAGGGTAVDDRAGGDWAAVVTGVLGLQEEGIFRTIVGFL